MENSKDGDQQLDFKRLLSTVDLAISLQSVLERHVSLFRTLTIYFFMIHYTCLNPNGLIYYKEVNPLLKPIRAGQWS
jgi:hypothetical protein